MHISNSGIVTRAYGSIQWCVRAPHDQTLLEMHGIGEESTVPQYLEAMKDYLDGKIKYGHMKSIMTWRRVIVPGDYIEHAE